MSIATNIRSTADILDLMPDSAQRVRSQSGAGRGLANMQAARSLAIAAMRGITRILSGMALSQATAGASTLTLYRAKLSAGAVLIDGKAHIFSAADPIVFIGTGQNSDAIKLDGSDAEVVAAAGRELKAVLVVVPINNNGAIYAQDCLVCGAEADNGSGEYPTYPQIRAALLAKYGANWDGVAGLPVARFRFQRKKVVNYVVAGTVAEGGTFAITINGTPFEVTADADDVAADVAGKLRTAIGSNVAGVTCGGTGANVLLTATNAGTTFDSSSEASGDGTLVGTQTDSPNQTIVDPDADETLLAERNAGSLWDVAE